MALFNLSGTPKTVTVGTQPLVVSKLTIPDMADIKEHFGVDVLNMDDGSTTDFVRGILWHVLRSNDPRITDTQKAARNYQLTVEESDACIPLSLLASPAGQIQFNQVLKACGFGDDTDEETEAKNETEANP